jgi:hypothetical protein
VSFTLAFKRIELEKIRKYTTPLKKSWWYPWSYTSTRTRFVMGSTTNNPLLYRIP